MCKKQFFPFFSAGGLYEAGRCLQSASANYQAFTLKFLTHTIGRFITPEGQHRIEPTVLTSLGGRLMHSGVFAQKVFSRLVSCILALSLIGLPLNSGVVLAAEPAVVPTTTKKVETEKVVVLNDHKKAVPATSGGATPEKVTVASTEKPTEHVQQTVEGEKKTSHVPVKQHAQNGHDEKTEEGFSTAAKIGIGVGVVAVIGGAALALSGGSGGDSGPKYPTAAELVGKWDGRGTAHDGERRYLGIYDLYAVGVHNYSIVSNDGVHKEGRGTWSIAEGTNTLTIRNDTGSIYVGDFQGEIFTTISMTTTNDRWDLVLTKK